jgi:CheY-like chemotaxis protein
MSQTPSHTETARVLIVDDNRIYREAFKRNLVLQNYDVLEAENMHQALEQLGAGSPDVVITDLQMRTETEGLDLIRAVKSAQPLLPVIMISAVGTFEEGAQAQKFGAAAVLSKSRIEEEIERLYAAIDASQAELQKARLDEHVLRQVRDSLEQGACASAENRDHIRRMLASPETHPYVRQEAFEVDQQCRETELQAQSRAQAETVAASQPAAAQQQVALNLEAVEKILRGLIPAYDTFSDDTRESLRIAEFLYDQQMRVPGSIDFSRNVGFSYCFAVENEVKARMAKRLQKFLAHDMTYALIMEMMENNNQSLSVYFHQHLLLLLRGREMDFTIDNVKQTLRRILEHQSRYKPDGLKALGIMLIAFGRTYTWQKKNRTIKVHNPLGLKGLESEVDTIRFAELLVSLQHFRNPYIHPEISDMEKLSIIRQTTVECLNMASQISG